MNGGPIMRQIVSFIGCTQCHCECFVTVAALSQGCEIYPIFGNPNEWASLEVNSTRRPLRRGLRSWEATPSHSPACVPEASRHRPLQPFSSTKREITGDAI
jgi:hypothetical protein